MKKFYIALLMGIALGGCQQQTETNKDSDSKAPAEATKTASASDTGVAPEADSSGLAEKDKMAYALGASMASNIGQINDQFESLDLDLKMVEQGFADRLGTAAKLTDEEVAQQTQIFSQKLRFAQQQQMQQQKQEMTEKNTKYLEDNLANGFTATESGLQYKVVEAAPEGAAQPEPTDTVRVHYTGKFTDGKEFDSSVGKGPFEFSLKGGVIQGWIEGVKLMSVGSKYQFVVPPELGYGFQTRGPIPAGSVLVFDVELLEIVEQTEQESAEQDGSHDH